MSNALAIASVTYVLKDLLNNGLIDGDITASTGVSVEVTSMPPDVIEAAGTEKTRLNIYMYQATQNVGWRNQFYPSHNSAGERNSNPVLALDLHYMLMAYGAKELHQEIVLGYGMQLLHENPVLAREAIRESLTPSSIDDAGKLPDDLRALAGSELAEQVEQIKISPENINTEEASRLWTAFGAKFRPNAVYKVTVVLIESRKRTRVTLPVQERRLYMQLLKQPMIEKLSSQADAVSAVEDNQKILADYFLILTGEALKAENLAVSIGGKEGVTEVVPDKANLSDTQIKIKLPGTLLPGVHGVQVVHKTEMKDPPLLRNGISSNVQAFVLSPEITLATASDTVNTGGGKRSAKINITVNPGISHLQQVIVLLNGLSAGGSSYSFNAIIPPPDPVVPVKQFSVTATNIIPGMYVITIQVDGAESPLITDEAATSITIL